MNPSIMAVLFRCLAVGHSTYAIINQAQGDTIGVFISLGFAYLTAYMMKFWEERS